MKADITIDLSLDHLRLSLERTKSSVMVEFLSYCRKYFSNLFH